MRDTTTLRSSLFRKELYQLELEYCNHYKRNDAEANNVRSKINSLVLENCPNWTEWSQREVQSIFHIYNSISLSSKTIRKIAHMDLHGLSDITTTSFGDAISYVSGIADVDLSNVQEVRLERYECAYTEGECVSCNQDNHHIYYSIDSNQVSSVDLLCHELGHAADFTNSRQASADDNALHRHQSLAEAVAFYCQFRYLQDHGNIKKRTGALGAFLYTYLTYLICRYCFEQKITLDKVAPVEAVDDEIFSSFFSAYTSLFGAEQAREFLAQKIYETQARFQGLGNVILEELNPRLGIPLGLALLEIENLDLALVSRMNILSDELKHVIESIDHSLNDKLSNMDALITKFIEQGK
ncbi:TPA: hypothetical protein QEM85_004233 [Pseudomonas putida]|uniref:hypothetical protein n=1 Tax=Pseudomonas putida TaxID=303 RepID=UPI00110CC2A4|nr:hypothetical protein [Pseudomonas putida]MDD1995653.1 hypothetical protein [Pseudomonas putida]HDS0919973.1 hypothetical protein [Pseudomonas putida]HDS0935212.1 hypothetical protein [Pseudomonas putida]HDS1785690.1 hypothetical protein [Pseudomonas putida]HDS3800823.1 hypothetical protein [Pseudomonas putida]